MSETGIEAVADWVVERANELVPLRGSKDELVIPEYQGAVVSFRGHYGITWLGVRGWESWYLTRRDAAEQRGFRQVTEEKLRDEIGSELQVLHQGGYNPAKPSEIQWPNDPSTYDPEEP